MAYSAIKTINGIITGTTGIKEQTSRPQSLSRYFGGHSRTSHPYVNGYWQFFISPPCKLFKQSADTVRPWFHATAEGFTPPSRNLNKADLPGQGGVGSSWVTGQSLMRTFSITHREYRELPMMRLFELWTSIIVPQIGVSEIDGHEWQASSYKGHAFVILTKPTGSIQTQDWKINENDIEEVYYFDGVWPENVPTDALSQDIGSNDIVQYTINYSFDGWPLTLANDEKGDIRKKAVEVLSNWTYQSTYDIYTSDMSTIANACSAPGDSGSAAPATSQT